MEKDKQIKSQGLYDGNEDRQAFSMASSTSLLQRSMLI